jgi:hypothetical protein
MKLATATPLSFPLHPLSPSRFLFSIEQESDIFEHENAITKGATLNIVC